MWTKGLDTGTVIEQDKMYKESCSWLKWNVYVCLTIHSKVEVSLPSESIISDGDLHLIGALVWQLQVMQEQGAVLVQEDSTAVLRPQVPDDVRTNGLDHSDRFAPLQLPLNNGLVGAGAGVGHREKSWAS